MMVVIPLALVDSVSVGASVATREDVSIRNGVFFLLERTRREGAVGAAGRRTRGFDIVRPTLSCNTCHSIRRESVVAEQKVGVDFV